jgi:O-antigen/teichoic acid export membrane protein
LVRLGGPSEFTRDVAFTAAVRAVMLGAALVGGVITARILLPEGKGIYASILVMPRLVATIASLGVRQAGAYFLGKREEDAGRLLGAMRAVWLPASAAGVVVALAGLVASGLAVHGWPTLTVAVACLPLTLYVTYLSGIGLGLRWIKRVTAGQLIQALSQVGLIVLLVWGLRLGVLGAFAALAGALLVHAVYVSVVARRAHPGPWAFAPDLARRLVRRGLGYAAALFVINLNYRVDIILLNQLLDSSSVGHYTVGVGAVELLWMVPTVLGFVVFAHSATATDAAEFSRSMRPVLRRVTLLVLALGAVGAALAPFVIPALYGEAFRPSVHVVWALLPGVVALVPARLSHGDLAGRGDPITGLKVFAITLAVNIALNLWWIPIWGIVGAAAASSVSYSLATLLLMPAYLRRSNGS